MSRTGYRPGQGNFRFVRCRSSMVLLITITVLACAIATMAAFPGANGKIVFGSFRGGSIFTMNPDGSNQTAVPYDPSVLIDAYEPTVSADGKRIALVSPGADGFDIWTLNFDGSNPRDISNQSGDETGASWSPSGTQVAYFHGPRGGQSHIWVVNDDGTTRRQLTAGSYNDAHPAWSPDGSKIAFATDRDGNWEIYVMNADGTGQTNLTNNPASDCNFLGGGGPGPSWSPDGNSIAFETDRDGNYQIYVMDANGTGQTRLTNDLSLDDSPAWSPEGTQIVFTSTSVAGSDIFVMNADGSKQTRLTTDPAWDGAADWQPVAVVLSTTSLTFGVQLIHTRSAAQAATLTNTGTTTLNISSITASGDFLQKNNCGTSVPAGASCTIKVTFRPNAKGVRTGTVTITDDAANSPQTIALAGTGTVVLFSSGSLDFGNQPVGTTSQPQRVTVTNVGTAPLLLAGIGITGTNFGDFVETTTCGSKLAPGASCAIDVRFRPKAKGSRQAFLDVADNGGGGPQRVALAGTGT